MINAKNHSVVNGMHIYVDADACPVKEIVAELGREFQVPVTFIYSYAHVSHSDPAHVRSIVVDQGAESADYAILNRVQAHDLIITQDYGLAAVGLSKRCIVLHHKGFHYDHDQIDSMLASRHASAKARRAGQKTKGPKALTKADKKNFRSALERCIKNKMDRT